MSDIVLVSQNLPASIEDLAKFILIGQEKLVAVKAQIRAISKLELARDVMEQKLEESRMLSEALLDAQVKFGEFTKALPTARGFASNHQNINNTSHQCNVLQSNLQCEPETKEQVITKLGFNKDQVHRFETLASNKDVVEQVKAEARENEDIPTRSRVLQLVKEKNKLQKPDIDPDFRYHATRSINEAISHVSAVQVNPERLACWFESLKDQEEQNFQLLMIDDAVQNLQIIKAYLTKQKGR